MGLDEGHARPEEVPSVVRDICFADTEKKLEKFKFKRLVSDSAVWYDEARNLTIVKYVDDLLASGPEAFVEEYHQELQKYLMMEWKRASEVRRHPDAVGSRVDTNGARLHNQDE